MTRTPATVLAAVALAACQAPEPLNVVVIIVDDLGWADTGVYGSTYHETPHIDALAATGMRFTNFYTASPVCSPTRASLMTGRDPARLQITNWIGGEQRGQLLQAEYERQLPLAEVTLGDLFRGAGYATAFVGKWHLGSTGYHPEDQGFDVNVAGHQAGQPGSYFFPYENPRFAISNVPGLEDGADGEHLTDRLTDESIEFITANTENPFLLVMSYYAVHTPLESKPDLEAYYEARAGSVEEAVPPYVSEKGWGTTRRTQNHPTYAGMIKATDNNIGRLMGVLDSLGLTDRTVIAFVSDNGGLSTLSGDRRTAPTSNAPLRSGKGWLYEGGIRAPLIIRAPDVAPGVTDAPSISSDLFPTLAALTGIPTSDNLDGIDLSPVLHERSEPERMLFWHFPHYHGSGNRPSGAVRQGNWKLIQWFETGAVELYDLASDPGESTDVSGDYPDVVGELVTALDAWRDLLDAQMPTPNPDWTGN